MIAIQRAGAWDDGRNIAGSIMKEDGSHNQSCMYCCIEISDIYIYINKYIYI